MNQILEWAARYGVQRIMWRGPWWLVALAIGAYLLYPQLAHSTMISTTSSASVGALSWSSGDIADLDAESVVRTWMPGAGPVRCGCCRAPQTQLSMVFRTSMVT